MQSTRTVFRYGLQALLRKRSAELDALKAELAAAKVQVAEQTSALEHRSAELADLEQYQRTSSREGAAIDVDSRMRLHLNLSEAIAQRQLQAARLSQAREHEDQIMDQLREARQALEILERHRERTAAQFDTEQVRQAQLATDDLYLSNRQARAAREREPSVSPAERVSKVI